MTCSCAIIPVWAEILTLCAVLVLGIAVGLCVTFVRDYPRSAPPPMGD